jgi:hypothetical protein
MGLHIGLMKAGVLSMLTKLPEVPLLLEVKAVYLVAIGYVEVQ